jgi:hypothetical protein
MGVLASMFILLVTGSSELFAKIFNKPPPKETNIDKK